MIIFLAASTLILVFSTGAENEFDEKDWLAAIEFRELNGLSTDEEHIRETFYLQKDTAFSRNHGFNLTTEEWELLDERDGFSILIEELKVGLQNNFKNLFSGIYFDLSTEKAIIQFTDGEQNIFDYMNILSYDMEKFTFKQVDFSYYELEKTMNKLIALPIKNFTISAFGINETENRVQVSMKDTSLNNLDKLSEYVDLNILDIIQTDAIFTPFAVSNKEIYYGQWKTARNASDGPCTIGFAGRIGSQNVAVTAGHCAPYDFSHEWSVKRASWFSPYYAIGNWAYKNTGGGTATYADVGYIHLDNDFEIWSKIGNTGVGALPASSFRAGTLSLSASVATRGGVTGFSYGTTSGTQCLWVPSVGTVCDLMGVNGMTAVTEGDSGAPVYRYTHGGEEAQIVGIISGGHNGIVYYSQSYQLQNYIGLDEIYLSCLGCSSH